MPLYCIAEPERRASDAMAPVVQHVLDALPERDGGRPAGEGPELGRVPLEQRDVNGSDTLHDLADLDRTLRVDAELVDHRLDGNGPARGGVVRAAGRGLGEQEP